MLTQPEPSYHGVVNIEALGPAAFAGRARTVPLRNTGSAISPMNAWLILQGIETLSLRKERHTDNAAKVAEYLSGHDLVEWVEYAGLPSSRYYEMGAQRHAGRAAASLRFDLAQLAYDLRTGAGLKQRQLADRMGTTQSVISRLEQAGRMPTLELLARLAAATDADLRLLVRRAGGDDLDVPLSA